MGTRALPLHSLIVLAALAALAPAAQAAKPCRPAGFHPVYLSGRVMGLESRDHRIALCDLKTKKVRQVRANGTLTRERGDRLGGVNFAASYDDAGLSFVTGGRARVMTVELPGMRTLTHRASSAPHVLYVSDGGLLFENGDGVYLLGIAAAHNNFEEIANPSVWAGQLALAEPEKVDPRVYWIDRDDFVTSTKSIRLGSQTPYPGERDLIAARDGRCAKAGFRLVFAKDRARVLRNPTSGAVAICDARSGALHDAASGVDRLAGFDTAGRWLLEQEDGDWAAYDLATGDRRAVSQPGDTYSGMRISVEGTVLYGVERAAGKAVETLTRDNRRIALSTAPNVDPASVALGTFIAFWREGRDAKSARVDP